MATNLKLLLGDIELVGEEVPQLLSELGGTQALQVHDFPGGVRTIQSLGAFPGQLSWKGVLLGDHAFSRAAELDRVRVKGDPIVVMFGPWEYLGVVQKFTFTIQHQWLVDYAIKIVVQADLSGPTATPSTDQTDETTLSQLEEVLAQYPGDNVTNIPEVTDSIGNFLSAVNNALQLAGGVIGLIKAFELDPIGVLAGIALSACEPLIRSLNSFDVAQGLLLIANINNITRLLNIGSMLSIQMTQINPNLMSMAAVHYGDATAWNTIAAASNIRDPQVIGVVKLTIPEKKSRNVN